MKPRANGSPPDETLVNMMVFFAANLPDISGRRPSGGPSGSRPAPSGAGQYDASAKSMAGGWINGDGSMMKPTRYGMFIRKIGGRDN